MTGKIKAEPETQIEQILRKYPESKSYIDLHSEINITTFISQAPGHTGTNGSKTERKALQNIGPREIVLITEAIRRASTEAESNFMDYRYFRALSLADCSKWMGCSPQTVFRVRKRLLEKAQRIIKK
jgi:DNA-directed RNA polymerase specialized sigma subunit